MDFKGLHSRPISANDVLAPAVSLCLRRLLLLLLPGRRYNEFLWNIWNNSSGQGISLITYFEKKNTARRNRRCPRHLCCERKIGERQDCPSFRHVQAWLDAIASVLLSEINSIRSGPRLHSSKHGADSTRIECFRLLCWNQSVSEG